MEAGSLFGLLAVLLLVTANGFFVAAEFALVKVRKTRIDQLAAEGKSSARIVQREMDNLSKFIATTQLGVTLASLALGWVGEPAIASLFEGVVKTWFGEEAAKGIASTIAVIIAFVIITIFHIVLGELVPKSIALQRAEKTAMFLGRPLYIFNRLTTPFVILLSGIGGFVLRLLGLNPGGEHVSVHSVEELEMLVTQSREAGVLDREEEVLLRRVFDFSDKTASQIMMPRTEVVGVPKEISFDRLVEVAAEEHYTRLPVYAGTIDNIIGVLHIKDLFSLVRKNGAASANQPFQIEQIMRPVLKVPETVSLEDLLARMKKDKVHLTVVIDEYGGTAGIVTFEDILEEIVGAVEDEFDTSEEGQLPEIQVLPDGSSIVSGLVALPEFAERFGLTLPATDYETIAGYVFGELGRTPQLGDEIVLGHYRLRIDELDNLRIARLKVQQIEKPEDPEMPNGTAAPTQPANQETGKTKVQNGNTLAV